MSDPEPLDTCGCCEGEAPVGRIENAPGLPALRYRLSTHGEFLERMLHAVPRTPERIMPPRPLAALTSRSPDDPTVAMLDACAVVGDILTFYQERIANEGYLRTATERRSVLELARAIGYELSPGVAASVYLAFRVEDAPGAPLVSDIAAGWQVQSVPPQGKLPQVFETSAPLTARAEWNELRPRLTRPAELAIMAGAGSPGAPALVLLGPHGTFPAGTPGLHEDLDPNDLHRLDTTEPSAARVDALEIRRTYLTDAAAGIAKGDLLLFAGRKGTDVDVLVLRVAACVDEPERRRIRVDLEPLPAPSAPPPALVGAIPIPYVSRVIAGFATVGLAKKSLTGTTLATEVASQNWRERDLQALLGIQGWGRRTVMRAMNNRKASPPLTLEAGAFTFREKVAFFGHTAPKWKSLPATNTKGNAYQLGWDTGDVNGTGSPAPTLSDERRIWTDSQGNKAPDQGPHAYLERPVKGLTTQGWTIFESTT